MVLRPFESASESGGNGTDWTDELLSGWQMIKGPNHGPTNGGITVKEFDGWTFIDPVSWNATALQGRDQFTKGVGVIAVADSDEYDDQADATFDASLITPVIDISGALENSLILKFDSSWRKEPQTGYVSVQYDGGDERVIFFRDGDTLDAFNETIELPLNNPARSNNLVIKWNKKGYNNWWWAIDNIELRGQKDEEKEETLPELSIYLENGQIVVSWPITEEIYLLERSSGLSPDQWGIVPIEELTLEGGKFVLRKALDSKAQFYRLTN